MSQQPFVERRARERLAILHCLRAPVGGLFRHVIDLATAQAALGHRVGVVCASTGDALTEARLLAFAPCLRLGLHRLPMGRDLGLSDVRAYRQVSAIAHELQIDIIHGHGAKGGAYARLAARALRNADAATRCYYTPHGGTLHFAPTTARGVLYGALERRLVSFTDGILFESRFAANKYMSQFGTPGCATKVVTNGLTPAEFEPVMPAADAADFVFVGELRRLKGVDVALEALAKINRTRTVRAVIVGDGPDAAAFKAEAAALDLDTCVTFAGAMRAREAFTLGRTLLVPSRAESLPYVVLEAIAGSVPVIATNVGGIPEIIAQPYGPLLAPGDVGALAAAIVRHLDFPAVIRANAAALKDSVRQTFSVSAMVEGVMEFYGARAATRKAA